jgi:hypothetical protein
MSEKKKSERKGMFPSDPNRDGMPLHKNLAMGKFDEEDTRKKRNKNTNKDE